jgi:hypothetical protein
MNLRKSMLTAAIILILAVAAIVGIYALGTDDAGDDPGGDTAEMINASVTITFGNDTTWSYDNISISTPNTTVYGLTMAAARAGNFTVDSTYYGQYDSNLITAINGVENGHDDRYWQYWVNGAYAEAGADTQPVHNHDVIAWKFTGYS